MYSVSVRFYFFFFNDTATTEIYTLSLHDALPISAVDDVEHHAPAAPGAIHRHQDRDVRRELDTAGDRKSTRLNSSHGYISYAVFCLKKKNKKYTHSDEVLEASFYGSSARST